MGYFAQLSNNGIVRQVISINNNVLNEPTDTFPDTELAGQEFIANILKLPGEWRQTSYNGSFRYNYAGEDFRFDPTVGEYGAFIPPQPFPSWVLDDDMRWQPPISYPTDGAFYVWNEENQTWIPVS